MVDPLFHPEAQAEYSAAIEWYEQRSAQAANRFESEVEQVLQRINQNPETFPRYDEMHRFAIVQRFPYSVVYRQLAGRVYVIAVAHSSRSPGYWQGRK